MNKFTYTVLPQYEDCTVMCKHGVFHLWKCTQKQLELLYSDGQSKKIDQSEYKPVDEKKPKNTSNGGNKNDSTE